MSCEAQYRPREEAPADESRPWVYHLRQDTDSYIVFSPVKYFKNVGLVNKKFEKGYLFNRKYFHATDSAISCVRWSNTEEEKGREVFDLTAYELDGTEVKKVEIKKAKKTFLEFYDKRKMEEDQKSGVFVAREGVEVPSSKADVEPLWNNNVIANLGAPAFALDSKNRYLVRGTYYHHGCVFPLRSDNYLEKLPLWVAKMFPQEKWYEKDVYNTTADGGDAYTKDTAFLKSCLFYTCLSDDNHCLSFCGSDGREYQNELCFDDGTLALADLQDMLKGTGRFSGQALPFNEDEQELWTLWEKIQKESKKNQKL